jgi:hypothetical protein
MQPWARATLRTYAAEGRYVECLATYGDLFLGAHGDAQYECAGALQEGNDQAVCSSACSRTYLDKRCVRIDEALARKLHPALFRYLDT